MRDELKDKIEVWLYGLAVAAWVTYAFLADLVKVQILQQVTHERRIEWGMILIATILYMLLRKVLNLKRQSKSFEIHDDFARGISAALATKSGASFDVYALSTQTFLHHIAYDQGTTFGRVRVLMPTESAVKNFFTAHHKKLSVNPVTAVDTINAQIEESIQIWEGLKTANRVKELVVRRIELFPTMYLAVIAENTAFTGSYYLDGLTTHHGISLAETNIFSGKQSLAPQIKKWFESFWKVGK